MKDKQTMALNLLNKGENLFLTGPGGVGKTAVLKAFASQTTKKLAITNILLVANFGVIYSVLNDVMLLVDVE